MRQTATPVGERMTSLIISHVSCILATTYLKLTDKPGPYLTYQYSHKRQEQTWLPADAICQGTIRDCHKETRHRVKGIFPTIDAGQFALNG